MFSQFEYRKDARGPSLSVVVLPPFMRTRYDFERDYWVTID